MRGRSGILERFNQINVLLHGRFPGGALQLGPSIVLGTAYQVSEARTLAFDIAARSLLKGGVQLEQGVVIGALTEFFAVVSGGLEASGKIGHVRRLSG